MAATMVDNGFKEIDSAILNKSAPSDLSGFDSEVQSKVENAMEAESIITQKAPVPDDPNICPNIKDSDFSGVKVGGMKRVQRGGPRRNARSAPGPGDSSEEDAVVGQQRAPPNASSSDTDDMVTYSIAQLREIRTARQKALEEIAKIPEKTQDDRTLTEDQINEQIENIMAGGRLFATEEETEEFTAHAREIREAMIRMRGIGQNRELTQLQDEGGERGQGTAATARAARIANLTAIAPADRSEEQSQELAAAQAQETRMNQLLQQQRENRYYFMLSIMAHISAALFIGMTDAPSWFFNSIGENVRFMFGADNLAASCDYDNFFNLGYNGDCETATRAAEIMWSTIIGVIGLLAVTFFGITLSDTSNPFMILAGLGAYSVDSLAALFRAMGGIKATVGAVAGAAAARAAPLAQTVGGVITWPLTRVANVCLRMVGRQPYRGGRKRRRTMKHKRKTRGRKGKKMRKTKNKRKRGSRKKQRGGNCGPMKHPNMTDEYRPNPSAMGGKKRRKGRKGKKTRDKTKRRYGKKRGTRKR